MSEGPRVIGEIDFRSNKVRVYYDDYSSKNTVMCCWSSGNTSENSLPTYVYMNWETGKITLPDGSPVPESKELTVFPSFLIVGQKELSKPFTEALEKYMEEEFKRRNGIK